VLAALLTLPVAFAGPAQAAAPTPCNGMFLTDPAGDAEYDANGSVPGGGKPGQPNMDITGLFFNYAPGADGKSVLTMNTVLANLDKTLPPSADFGASGGIWYYGYYILGDETRFVRGANRSGGDFEFKYGFILDGFFITEGDTTGTVSEGPNGVVSVVIPEEAGGKVGDKLGGFIATVDTIEGEDDFAGVNHQADFTPLAEGEESPSLSTPNGKDYTVTACPPGGSPPPATGGGDTGDGGTTPPPSGGSGGGGAAPAQPAPAFSELPWRPAKPALGSAKKAKKKGLVFKAGANADISNLVVKLMKGTKTIATGKAATFKTGVATFKLKKSKKLKKGKYKLVATGVVDGKSLSVTHAVSVKK
jgi:hypothetical protein